MAVAVFSGTVCTVGTTTRVKSAWPKQQQAASSDATAVAERGKDRPRRGT
jgi:hypothetical protein